MQGDEPSETADCGSDDDELIFGDEIADAPFFGLRFVTWMG